MTDHFKLSNIQEVNKFEEYLKAYYLKNTTYVYSFDFLDLEEWYLFCNRDEKNGGRIFTCVFDIKLNLIHLDIEMRQSSVEWGKLTRNQSNINILESEELFESSLGSLQHYWNFVLRYRALWDKLMGLIVLINIPSKYKEYIGGKSRKANFRKIIIEYPGNFGLNVDKLFDFIEAFDNMYRTSEAHGNGKLRKWVLSPSTLTSFETVDPALDLGGGYWNELFLIIRFIDHTTLPKIHLPQ